MGKKSHSEERVMLPMLNMIRNGKLRFDVSVQRAPGQWTKQMKNELLYTVLDESHVPEIILGEEKKENGTTQFWVIDGIQRLSTWLEFRYHNYKIGKLLNPIVEYERNIVDDNGNFMCDEDDNVLKELVEYNLQGKYYDDLPEELKEVFDSFQIHVEIHTNCNKEMIAMLVKRYNNHISMNVSQKGFTYASEFADEIREVANNKFFLDCGEFTESNRKKGLLERVVGESVMTIHHLDDWKAAPVSMFQYINSNSNSDEIGDVEGLLEELYDVCSDKYDAFFNKKNACVFVAAYNIALDLGKDTEDYANFLDALDDSLANVECGELISTKHGNCKTWTEIDALSNTKDSKVIKGKINFLTKLMKDFWDIKENFREIDNVA